MAKRDGVRVEAGRACITLPYTKTVRQPVFRWIWARSEATQFCPVKAVSVLLQTGQHLNTGGIPLVLHPLTLKPLSSAVFIAEMRRWLQQVPGLQAARFSGISFRKGCLQELARGGVSRQDIAVQATHASLASQRHYITLDKGVQQLNAAHLAVLF